MRGLILFMLFALIAVIVFFALFIISTEKIIREQDRRLTKLVEDNNRLRQALKKTKDASVVNIYTEDYAKGVKDSAKNIKFGGF